MTLQAILAVIGISLLLYGVLGKKLEVKKVQVKEVDIRVKEPFDLWQRVFVSILGLALIIVAVLPLLQPIMQSSTEPTLTATLLPTDTPIPSPTINPSPISTLTPTPEPISTSNPNPTIAPASQEPTQLSPTPTIHAGFSSHDADQIQLGDDCSYSADYTLAQDKTENKPSNVFTFDLADYPSGIVIGNAVMAEIDGHLLGDAGVTFIIELTEPQDRRFLKLKDGVFFIVSPDNADGWLRLRERHLECKGKVRETVRYVDVEPILANITSGQGGIENAVSWWDASYSTWSVSDKIYDPIQPPVGVDDSLYYCLGVAWNTMDFHSTVVVFQEAKQLSFQEGGWATQVCLPRNIVISPNDVGLIQATWLEKEYGGEWSVAVLEATYANLVTIAGFEDDYVGHWIPGDYQNLSLSSPGHSGQYALCSTQGTNPNHWAYVYQTIPVEPEATYEFTIWLNTQNAAQFHLRLDWLGDDLEVITEEQVDNAFDGDSEGWKQMGSRKVAPVNARHVNIEILHGLIGGATATGSTVCIDDVLFMQVH